MLKKTQSACESVFKLDREARLPAISVIVAKPVFARADDKNDGRKKSKVITHKVQPPRREETPKQAIDDQYCVSRVFGQISENPVQKPNCERLKQLFSVFPQRKPGKRVQEATCFTATEWQETFNRLTCLDIKVDQAMSAQEVLASGSSTWQMSGESRPMTKSLRPSFIESILGKRPASRAIKRTTQAASG